MALVKPKLGDDVLQTDIEQTEAINAIGEFFEVIGTLPVKDSSKNLPMPQGFGDNAFIIGKKTENANNIFVEITAAFEINYGITATITGGNLRVSNKADWANNREVRILLYKPK